MIPFLIFETLEISFNNVFSLCLIISLIVYVVVMVKIMRSPKVPVLPKTNDAPDLSPTGESLTSSKGKPKLKVKGREKSAFEMVEPKWKLIVRNPKAKEKEKTRNGKSD